CDIRFVERERIELVGVYPVGPTQANTRSARRRPGKRHGRRPSVPPPNGVTDPHDGQVPRRMDAVYRGLELSARRIPGGRGRERRTLVSL
ncbi:MAG: hypothetical protein AAFN70_15200, partial [Planctomycetota bacterium]